MWIAAREIEEIAPVESEFLNQRILAIFAISYKRLGWKRKVVPSGSVTVTTCGLISWTQ